MAKDLPSEALMLNVSESTTSAPKRRHTDGRLASAHSGNPFKKTLNSFSVFENEEHDESFTPNSKNSLEKWLLLYDYDCDGVVSREDVAAFHADIRVVISIAECRDLHAAIAGSKGDEFEKILERIFRECGCFIENEPLHYSIVRRKKMVEASFSRVWHLTPSITELSFVRGFAFLFGLPVFGIKTLMRPYPLPDIDFYRNIAKLTLLMGRAVGFGVFFTLIAIIVSVFCHPEEVLPAEIWLAIILYVCCASCQVCREVQQWEPENKVLWQARSVHDRIFTMSMKEIDIYYQGRHSASVPLSTLCNLIVHLSSSKRAKELLRPEPYRHGTAPVFFSTEALETLRDEERRVSGLRPMMLSSTQHTVDYRIRSRNQIQPLGASTQTSKCLDLVLDDESFNLSETYDGADEDLLEAKRHSPFSQGLYSAVIYAGALGVSLVPTVVRSLQGNTLSTGGNEQDVASIVRYVTSLLSLTIFSMGYFFVYIFQPRDSIASVRTYMASTHALVIPPSKRKRRDAGLPVLKLSPASLAAYQDLLELTRMLVISEGNYHTSYIFPMLLAAIISVVYFVFLAFFHPSRSLQPFDVTVFIWTIAVLSFVFAALWQSACVNTLLTENISDVLSELALRIARMLGEDHSTQRETELRSCYLIVNAARKREIDSTQKLKLMGVVITKPLLSRLAAAIFASLLTAVLRAILSS